MKNDLVAQLEQEIAATRAKLTALETAHAALAGLNGATRAVTRAPEPRHGAAKPVKRAPAGFLEDAMAKVIKAQPGLTNGEVRTALANASYAYRVPSGLHVGKRLSAMVDEKRLTVKLDGNLRRYHPAK